MTGRKRLGFNRGTRRGGAARFARVFWTEAQRTRRRAAHGIPVTGRLRSPPYPAAAPASTTARPTPTRQVCREP